MEKKKLLSKTTLRTTARILLVTYLFFIPEGPVRASDFDSALNAGKSIGTSSVSDYNPTNLNNTLQGKGLGTAATLAPQAGQAATDRGHYESFYNSPGGMSSASSEVGDFVNSSYQTRDKYDLSQDPTFGNKCLETDSDGKCLKWSTSQDLIKESYPDCKTVQVPRYDNQPTTAQCSGTRSSLSMNCPVRTVVRVETEVVAGPCRESLIVYKPGQVYAVCKDNISNFKVYTGNQAWQDDCYCPNIPGGFLCENISPDYILGTPPAGATYLGKQVGEILNCQTEDKAWDWGYWRLYNWYRAYVNSTIERIYIDYDSPCGDVSRFQSDNSCMITRVEQCDPNGNNCLLTLDEGNPTGTAVSMQYLTYTSSPVSGSCGSCSLVCAEWEDYFNGDFWGRVCVREEYQCSDPALTPCTGSCPSDAVHVTTLSNSVIQAGVSQVYSQSDIQAACVEDVESCSVNEYGYNSCTLTPQIVPSKTLSITRNVYYRDPRVCNTFSGSIENYRMCMDGTNITLSNTVASGTALTQTQQFSTTSGFVRAYGGPDVRSILNGWYLKTQFECFSASDTCQPLRDQGCRMYAQKCVDPADPLCNHIDYIYQCGGMGGITGYDVAVVCAGNIRCMGSDCKDTSYNANRDFNKIPQAAEIINALRMDGTEAEIFPGKVRECQSGPKQCCNANTGGVSIVQYVMAAKAAAEMYSTLSTGVAATGQAMAAAATTTINTVASSAGLATVNTTLTGTTVVSTFAGGSTVGAGGVITTATVEGASGAAVSVVGGGTAGIGASTMLAAAATCMAVAGLIVAAYVIATTVYEMMFA